MTTRSLSKAAALGVAALLALGGCSLFDQELPPEPLDPPVVSAPSGASIVADPAASAATAASAQLFESSPVVVVSETADAAVLAGASAAVALGVPHFVEGGEGIADELLRLDATHVISVGPRSNGDPDDGDPVDSGADTEGESAGSGELEIATWIEVEPTVESLSRATGVEFTERVLGGGESPIDAIAALERGGSILLVERASDGDSTTSPADDAVERLPLLRAGDPVDGVVALVSDDADAASVATAVAAGVAPHPLVGVSNPQASADAIEAVSAEGVDAVIALGPSFADEESLDWKVRSAMTGRQLPAGGQLLFPDHMMVALYGTPGAPILGLLGEQGLEASIARAKEHAAAFEPHTDKEVLPAFEIITTVASAFKGTDGNYSNELEPDEILEWARAAQAEGMYVVIDLQPGRTDFLTQAKLYEELLREPWVGLALDPEWRLRPNERHLVTIGQVDAAEVNEVVDYLTELVREHDLPPKLLVLHQFRLDMIERRERVVVDRPEVPVLIHVDGQGSQPAKQDTWQWLRRDAPDVAWGWKNFYDEDIPMLTPRQTAEGVDPVPDLVTYQ